MKTCFKILTTMTLLGLLLTVTGCAKPLDLSMQRNRIFLLGRLLVGKICDVRLIYRVGPNEPTPVTVTADLSEIGGDSEQELAPGDKAIWRWSGQVTPDAAGEQSVRITARDAGGQEHSSKKLFPVYDTDKAVAIGAGCGHNLAVKADGTVIAWFVSEQPEDNGQCDVPATVTNAVAVAGGSMHSIALNFDGTVVAWGKYYKFLPNNDLGLTDMYVPEGLADVVAIAALGGYDFVDTNLALKADGTVVAWGGTNFYGECNVPADLKDVIAIAAGDGTNFAIKHDGTVVAWGAEKMNKALNAIAVSYVNRFSGHALVLNKYGILKRYSFIGSDYSPSLIRVGSGFKAVAGDFFSGMGLRKDGKVVSWLIKVGIFDEYFYLVNDVPGKFLAIPNGGGQKIALTANGSLKAWKDSLHVVYEPVPDELQ